MVARTSRPALRSRMQCSHAHCACSTRSVALATWGTSTSSGLRGERNPCVRVDGRELSFSIEEMVARHPHQRTEKDKGEYEWAIPRWDYEPTGRLRLILPDGKELSARHRWEDRKRQTVEDCLPAIIGSFQAVADALRAAA